MGFALEAVREFLSKMRTRVSLPYPASFDLARVHARRTGMVNSLWPWDAYPELPLLEPGATVTIADLPGHAVITCLHATKFANANEHRGILLRIYWDDETVPAVQCPIGDFFCDALQGKGQYFSPPFMERVRRRATATCPCRSATGCVSS